MDFKSKQHKEFLSQLNYFDSSKFILRYNSSDEHLINFSKTSLKNTIETSAVNFNEIFSLRQTKQFNEIRQYIQKTNSHNLPLLIKCQKYSDKQLLLCQVMQHYNTNSQTKNIHFIPNFSSVISSYSQILYNIMIKLRINFGIDQKVQINQEKIRRYFHYWLDITSEKIEKSNIGNDKCQKDIVVIIIDGIDQLKDTKNMKIFPQFWLPQTLPKNIRLILTEKLQEASKVKVVNFEHKYLSQNFKKKLNPELQSMLAKKNLTYTQIKIINSFLRSNNQLKIETEDTFEKIFEKYILQSQSQHLSQKQIKSLILCLCLSKKGLTSQELRRIMKIRPMVIEEFLIKFQSIICNYNQYYLITNSDIKQMITYIYDPMNQKKQAYHQIISKVIKKEQLCLRKLEEQIHHLTLAGKYFELKEVLTEIQSFLILYTPPCKYLLCASWKKLEQHLNSDPVFEYNKSVQSFLTHYRPKQEQLFKIVYQLSMFFREYSDFQGAKLPYFRHPLIKGQQQLQQISIYQQLKHLKMITSIKQPQKPSHSSPPKITTNQKSPTKSIISTKPQQSSIQYDIQQQQNENIITTNQIEKFNLQIKSNREKFRNYYVGLIKEYLKEYYIPVRKLHMNDTFIKNSHQNQTQLQQQDDYEENIFNMINEDFSIKQKDSLDKIKTNLILKNLDQYFEENYHRQQMIKFYYYKQWIWLQFPWICQSLSSNFSKMIQENIVNPTQYMSVEKQLSLIKDVLKISQVSKENKSAIYDNKKIQLHSIKPKKTRNERNTYSKSITKNPLKQQIVQSRLTVNPKKPNLNYSFNNSSIISPKQLNLAKYSLNLTTIDQKLLEQINKQTTNRHTFDSRLVHKSQTPFITSVLNKSDQKQNMKKLPYLSNNHHSISRIIKPSYNGQSYQTRIKKQQNQLNLLINKNKQLKRNIQEIEKTSIMLGQINVVTPLQKNLIKIKQLQTEKQKLLKKHFNQQKLKTKLQTIIKICDNNQSHEKQSQVLNLWIDNLKIMTNYQNKNINKNVMVLNEFVEETKSTIKMLKEKKEKLKSQLSVNETVIIDKENNQKQNNYNNSSVINNNSKKPSTIPTRSPSSKNTTILKKQTIHSRAAKSPTLYSRNNKTTKNTQLTTIPTKLLHSPIYLKLNQLFKFDQNKNNNLLLPTSSFTQQQQYYQKQIPIYNYYNKQQIKYLLEQFEEKIEKYKEIEMNVEDVSYENDELQSRIQELKEQIHDLEEGNEKLNDIQQQENDEQELQKLKQRSLKEKILKEIRERTKVLQQCLSSYVSG